MQIFVRQISGLGNQLFQYAAGRYYAKRHEAPMRLIVDPPGQWTSHGHPRPFLLSHFSISGPTQPMTDTDRFILSRRRSLAPLVAVHNRLRGIQVFDEPEEQRYRFLPDAPLRGLPRLLYLAGYWQCHELVSRVEDEVRTELQLREPATGRNREMLSLIEHSAAPVSLHVRRGDYTLAAEGNIALPLLYYYRATAEIRQRVPRPTFFVFSDDMAFAREHLRLGNDAVFVDHNDQSSPHEDLRLMAACRHHIIANSTLSWWGAWLNPRSDKVVIAPKYWHLRPETYYPGLLPPEWTTIAI